MERIKLPEKVTEFLKKYRYVALVILAGLILMCLPQGRQSQEPSHTPTQAVDLPDAARQLEQILSQVAGAGEVKVLLTQAEGARTVYQTDRGSDGVSMDTVIVTDADRTQQGLVSQTDPPVYLGAVIVCRGADDPKVRLAIVEAVSDATGLGADRITVLKMK